MIDILEKSAQEDGGWFDQNELVYQSELPRERAMAKGDLSSSAQKKFKKP
ncbi:MAG: hypothetical protein HY790_08785 [Deltaproteobacteria bacterium]|nr:hypothetical protein [Deltaproteobacteria bacterium]MBI4795914.1 hypothetical protein [Deltaproteobacteria bacterium]